MNIFAGMRRQQNPEATNLAEALILAFIWLVIFASPIFLWYERQELRWEMVFSIWNDLLPFLGLSLLNHFILVPFLFFRRRNLYFVVAMATLLLFTGVLWSINDNRRPAERQPAGEQRYRAEPPDNEIIPERPRGEPGTDDPGQYRELPERRQNPPQNFPGNIPPNLNIFLIALLILGFDTGIRAIFRGARVEQEKELLEKEKVKSELAFLRNQISPHFFMNTLNNIHSLIDIDTEEAKEAVIRLSKLMQHLLYDSKLETIPLHDEITFIRSYTELMKLRFTEKVKVNLEIQADDPEIRIPPMLFTALIENAFKYGVSYKQPSFIAISLVAGPEQLEFSISNSIITGRNQNRDPEKSGIGLDNTRKRLDLLYGKRYVMTTSEEGTIFTVSIKLPI